jgi:hypothetical protein
MTAFVPPAVAAAALARARALATLHALARGLPPGPDGAGRLLERVAATDEPESLRAALVELGALAVVRTGSEGGEA